MKILLIVGVVASTFSGLMHVYSFLAIPSSRVEADVLVVEGWLPDYVLEAAVREFNSKKYSIVVTSGMEISVDSGTGAGSSLAFRAARHLESLGVDSSKIIACPVPYTIWNRTSNSALVVRDQLLQRGIKPNGLNVLTVAPHARQTHLAYGRIMKSIAPVGIVSVPKENLEPPAWWKSRYGIIVVGKLFFGWFRELLFGLRS